MLISNYYHEYSINNESFIWWDANITSSSNYDTIFEVEMLNVNKSLNNEWLEAEFDSSMWYDSRDSKFYNIYYKWENKVIWSGYIKIKNA